MTAAVAEKPYLTPPQVAEMLGVDAAKIVAAIRRGELVAFDLANPGSTRPRFRISREALASWLASRATRQPAKPRRQRRKSRATVDHFAEVK